jgi:UDP-N-acetylmuramate dehydrogenase
VPDLAEYTTLRLGGPAARFTAAETADDLIAAVRAADRVGEPVLVLGGGSNLVVADAGFPGAVIRVATAGVTASGVDEAVSVTAAAGENWSQLVDWAIAEKLSGIECLAGIPGLAGATPIQNVGAYGQEVAATISAVRAYDRATAAEIVLGAADCDFAYRSSIFKTTGWNGSPTGRYVVLDVNFRLRRDPMSTPVKYAELASSLGIDVGDQAPIADVAAAVLELRRGKGMVLDDGDPDTNSAGSFFTNPVLDRAQLAEVERVASVRSPGRTVPRFPADGGLVKVPAAWLIEQAGFTKGYPGHGAARISSKHTLALANLGGATTAGLIDLARQVVTGVEEVFGVRLANEPTLVGVRL